MNGKVKWYNSRKGFGFIEGEDGQDYFVHFSEVPQGVFLRENDEVTFEPAETDKGKQAKGVALAGKASAAKEEVSEEEAPAEESASEEETQEDSEEF